MRCSVVNSQTFDFDAPGRFCPFPMQYQRLFKAEDVELTLPEDALAAISNGERRLVEFAGCSKPN
jgi:hypothetical protein